MPDNNQGPLTKAVFEAGLKALREYIDERTRDMQTELLRGFREDRLGELEAEDAQKGF